MIRDEVTLDDAIRGSDMAELALPANVYLIAAYIVARRSYGPDAAQVIRLLRRDWPDVAESGETALAGFAT